LFFSFIAKYRAVDKHPHETIFRPADRRPIRRKKLQ